MPDYVTISLLTSLFLVISFIMMFFFTRYYEWAILVMILSPCVSTVFTPNSGAMIGEDCNIGSNVVVEPGKIIGRRCKIASLKRLGDNVPSNSKVM